MIRKAENEAAMGETDDTDSVSVQKPQAKALSLAHEMSFKRITAQTFRPGTGPCSHW